MHEIFNISQLDNGWILHRMPYDRDDNGEENAFVYGDDINESKNKCKALHDLLWSIVEELKHFSKHDEYNVVIKVEDNNGKEVEI